MKIDDLGKLFLRIALGGGMLFHGVAKISSGIGGIEKIVVAKGLPEFVAYGVYVGEILAPALMIVGFQTRIAALVFAINMGVAVWLAHPGDLLVIKEHGEYALELQGIYILGGLALACIGAGRYSIDRR